MSTSGGNHKGPGSLRFDAELHQVLEALSRARLRLELGLTRERSQAEQRTNLRETLSDVDEAVRFVSFWMDESHRTAPFDEEDEGPSLRNREGASFDVRLLKHD